MSVDVWIDRARSDPEGVAGSADAPAIVLLSLAAAYPEVVARNPAWRLNFVTGDDGIGLLKQRRKLAFEPYPEMNGLLRLLRSSASEAFTKRLASSGPVWQRVLALTSPTLSPQDAQRVWDGVIGEWNDAGSYNDSMSVFEYSGDPVANALPNPDGSYGQVSEHVVRENTLDEVLRDSPLDLVTTWIRYGFGSDDLHARWVDEVFDGLLEETRERSSLPFGPWVNLSSGNAERLFEALLSETYHSASTGDSGGLWPRRLRAGVADHARWVVNVLLSAPTTPARVLQRLYEMLVRGPSWMRQGTDQASLTQAFKGLAEHPNTPIEVLQELANKLTCRDHLLANPAVSDAFAEHLMPDEAMSLLTTSPASAPSWYARWVLERGAPEFSSSRISQAYLNPRLAQRPDVSEFKASVRQQIARHNPLPESVTRQLVEDPARSVRAHLAQYSHASVVHEELWRDREARVRAALAVNGATPLPILARLRHDTDASVTQAAERSLQRLVPDA